MGGAHADVSKHVKAYIGVFIALAVLTVATVLASTIHVTTGLHITIALVIATIKASLVAAIFMHLKWERGATIWWTLILCGIFFVVLMMLPSITAFDHPPRVQEKMWDVPAAEKAPAQH